MSFIQPGSVVYTQGFGSRPESVEVPFIANRAPTVNDVNFPLGKHWLYKGNVEYVLVDFISTTPELEAVWVINSSGQDIIFDGNTGTAAPSANTINIVTANSTPIFNASGSTLTLDFGLSNLVLGSTLPNLISGTENCGYGLNNLNSITSGSGNSAFGWSSGATMTSAINNCLYGIGAGGAITISSSNCLFGANAGTNINIGSGANIAIGYNSLDALLSGAANVVLGSSSGTNYTTNESSNILISNVGVTGESGIIRIGSSGTHTQFYAAGISGVTVSNPQNVTINSANGQLGVRSEVVFQATLSASTIGGVTGNGAVYTIPFNTAAINQGSGFNTSTGIFTAPQAGNYLLTYTVCLENLTTAMTDMKAHIVTTVTLTSTSTDWRTTEGNTGVMQSASGNSFTGSGSVILFMNQNDTAKCIIAVSGGVSNSANVQGSSLTTFCGQLIS